MAMNVSGSGDQASSDAAGTPEKHSATDRFDVFISFAKPDKDWAEGFLLAALTTSGIRCCTVDNFPAGMPALEASSRAVELADRIPGCSLAGLRVGSCTTVRNVVGPTLRR